MTYPHPPLDLGAATFHIGIGFHAHIAAASGICSPTDPHARVRRAAGIRRRTPKVTGPPLDVSPWNPMVLHTLGRAQLIDTTGNVDAGAKAQEG